MNAPPTAVEHLTAILTDSRRGEAVGVTSVCSAHPLVLDAAARHAAARQALLCVESTASQVNQQGGYTGVRPAEFARSVRETARTAGLPDQLVLLGGDHLGPYPWRDGPAAAAMDHATTLVSACVAAGYLKIHLDASMGCADDPGGPGAGLDEETAISRTVALCRAAEETAAKHRASPVYVIGTEVPAPGGERAGDAGPAVTPGAAVVRTLELARSAFAAAGLDDAWSRVVAVVAQPGVEFGDGFVHSYDPAAAAELVASVRGAWPVVFEAHSTDYQTPAALRGLVADGFAILKVGPWLTFALREALFALEAVERDLLGGRDDVALSRLRETLVAEMLADPRHWSAYYRPDDETLAARLVYSYSDRCRYYWARREPSAAVARLFTNLEGVHIPLELLSQHLPTEYEKVRAGDLAPAHAELVRVHVAAVLDAYAAACGAGASRV